MNNGDMFDLYYVDKMLDPKKLSEERWLVYKDGRGNDRYLNIAQISDIFIKKMQPIEREG